MNPPEPAWSFAFLLLFLAWASPVTGQLYRVEEVRTIESELLSGPSSVLEVGDDALFLVDRLAQGIFRISPEGAWLEIAGIGEGPGELKVLGGLSLRGDTLCANDPSTRSLVLFNLGGEFIDEVSIPMAEVIRAYPLSFPVMLLGDGDVLTVPAPIPMGGPASRPVGSAPYFRANPNGQVMDTLMLLETSGTTTHLETGSTVKPQVREFFVSPPTVEVDPRGEYLAKVEETATGLRVTWLHLPTGGRTIQEDPGKPGNLSRADVNAVLAGWAEQNAERLNLQPARVEALLRDALRIPKEEPFFTDASLGTGGYLWLRGFTASDSVRWTRYSAQGEEKVTIWLGSADEILDAGGDWMWITRRDDFDVPTLVRLVLRSASPPTSG